MSVTLRTEIKNVSNTRITTNIPQTKVQPSPKQLYVPWICCHILTTGLHLGSCSPQPVSLLRHAPSLSLLLICSGNFEPNLHLYKYPSNIVPVVLPHYTTNEDGTDRVFWNVGTSNSDAEELPKRKNTTFRTQRQLEIKNSLCMFCNKYCWPDDNLLKVKTCCIVTYIRGATQNFREFEYTAQTVSTTNLCR